MTEAWALKAQKMDFRGGAWKSHMKGYNNANHMHDSCWQTYRLPSSQIIAAPLTDSALDRENAQEPETIIVTNDILQARVERIETRFPDFGTEIRKAQSLVESQPDSALIAVRRSLESVVRPLYTALLGKESGRVSLYDMISELDMGGYLSEAVKPYLHTVRTLGNIAAHGNASSVIGEDANLAIMACIRTAEWIIEEVLF